MPGVTAAGLDERERTRLWLRLCGAYVASFAVLGVYMQYFPVWLRDLRGCSEADITLVFGLQVAARTVAGPLWARAVDRRGNARAILALLAAMSCLCCAGFLLTGTVLELAVCAFAFGCCYPPMHPILDNVALDATQRVGLRYGRIRACGSLSFLLANVLLGLWLSRAASPPPPAGVVLPLLLGLLVVVFASTPLLPAPPPRHAVPAERPLRDLLRPGPFLLFLAAAGLVQGSHGPYYNLSTLHWREHGGHDEAIAALLWAVGVLAETVLFFGARGGFDRLRPTTLLLAGALAAVVRWCVIATTTALPWLFASALLHALSFGCTYLGSLRFVQRRVLPGQQATAQGLLGAATSGVGTVIASLLCGQLYAHFAGGSFYAMAGLAALGGCLAWRLRRRGAGESGGVLPPPADG